MRSVLPEPLRDHFVVVGQRRFPPKQVLGRVLDAYEEWVELKPR